MKHNTIYFTQKQKYHYNFQLFTFITYHCLLTRYRIDTLQKVIILTQCNENDPVHGIHFNIAYLHRRVATTYHLNTRYENYTQSAKMRVTILLVQYLANVGFG